MEDDFAEIPTDTSKPLPLEYPCFTITQQTPFTVKGVGAFRNKMILPLFCEEALAEQYLRMHSLGARPLIVMRTRGELLFLLMHMVPHEYFGYVAIDPMAATMKGYPLKKMIDDLLRHGEPQN